MGEKIYGKHAIEEGIKMARLCQAKLDKAKAKIETLVKEKNGEFKLKPLEEDQN